MIVRTATRGFHFALGNFHVGLLYGYLPYDKQVPFWEFELGSIWILIHKLPWEGGTWSKSKIEDWQKEEEKHWRIFRRVGIGFGGASIYFNLWKLKLAINITNPFMLFIPFMR